MGCTYKTSCDFGNNRLIDDICIDNYCCMVYIYGQEKKKTDLLICGDDLPIVVCIILIPIVLFFLADGLEIIKSIVGAAINPEYWALKQILINKGS